MTKEERIENLKKINTAIDGIEARLRQMSDSPNVGDEEWMGFHLALQGVTQMRMYVDIVERYTLKRD